MRGTIPQAIDTLPQGTTADRPQLDPFAGSYAEGAGLEPDPEVGPDMTSIDRLKTPVFFTLLPATLAVKTLTATHNFKLTHEIFTSVGVRCQNGSESTASDSFGACLSRSLSSGSATGHSTPTSGSSQAMPASVAGS